MQQRQTTTKSDIKEAFIQLLATKSLEDITISQLTKKAGVNRSTFYLHYLDKQDFLEQLKEETLTTVRMILRKETFHPKEALESILSHFQENSAFFVEIAKNPSFRFADNIRSFILGWINGCRMILYRISLKKIIFQRQLLRLKMMTTTNYVGLLPVGKSICAVMPPWQRPLFSFDLSKEVMKV